MKDDKKIGVDGDCSGGSIVRKQGSEDPRLRKHNLFIYPHFLQICMYIGRIWIVYLKKFVPNL